MPGMTFDGVDDRVTGPGSPVSGYGFSMFVAVNFSSLASESRVMGVWRTTETGDNATACFIRCLTAPSISARRNGTGGLAGGTSSVTPTTGVWYFIGATFQSSTATSITINGENLATGASTDVTFPGTVNTLSVGAANNSAASQRYLSGTITAPTIWDVVLTQQEFDAMTVSRYHPTRIRPERIVFHALSLFPSPIDIKGRALTLEGGGSAMGSGPPLTWQ